MNVVKIKVSLVLLVALLMLGGCGKPETPNTQNSAKEQESQTTPEQEKNPGLGSAGKKLAIIETEKGNITIELFVADAPKTTANFIKLTDQGFYNGLTFHRREEGFVIQGGDPEGNGSGGPGYTIQDEVNRNTHTLGAVAMAKSREPDSAGSQFYITLAPAPALDAEYTVFGQVVEGMDVVQQIQIGDKMNQVTIKDKK